MSMILAPYNDSMHLGQGFNSYTHELCIDHAVEVREEDDLKGKKSPAQDVSYSSRFVEKLSDVMETMNVSYSTSIKKGTVEIGGSTSTIDESNFKTSDLNAVVSVKVTNQTTSLQTDCKFNPMKHIKPSSREFGEVYGDCYISGFIHGGIFTGILSIKVLDRSQKDNVMKGIKNALSPSSSIAEEFTLNNFDSSTSNPISKALKGTEITVSVTWTGGGQIKEEATPWDFDSMFAAAAAFPAKVAACPQKTWAILTKYKSNRSFVEWTVGSAFRSLEYDLVNTYTAELFNSFMDYKLLLAQVQQIISNRDQYQLRTGVDKYLAIEPTTATLLSVRSAMRDEQTKIVEAVEALSRDPSVLKRQHTWSETHRAPVVTDILTKALGKDWMLNFKNAQTKLRKKQLLSQTGGGLPQKERSLLPVSTNMTYEPRVEDGTAHSEEETFTLVKDDPNQISSSESEQAKEEKNREEEEEEENFDFSSLVPPEIWEDLMPEPKDPSTVGFTQTGFVSVSSTVAPTLSQTSFNFNIAGEMPSGPAVEDIQIVKDKKTLEKERDDALAAAESAELMFTAATNARDFAIVERDTANSEVSRLKTKLKDSEASGSSLTSEISEAYTRIAALETAAGQTKAEIAAEKAALTTSLETANGELSTARQTVEKLTADLAAARTTAAQQAEKLAALQKDLGDEKSSTQRLANEVSAERAGKDIKTRECEQLIQRRNELMAKAIPMEPRPGCNVWIMLISWGNVFIYDQAVINRCYQLALSRERFKMDCDIFRSDPLPGVRKSGIILWKMEPMPLIRYCYGWEYDMVAFS